MPDELNKNRLDVVVVGGGLAGTAAAVHLARAGLHALCIDANEPDAASVGESLDWSAPDLFANLGLPMQRFIDEGLGTWKRHVTLRLADGSTANYVPSEWLARPPFNVELRTLHVDRTLLNLAVHNIANFSGLRIMHDHVTEVETRGRRVVSVATANNGRISSPWFIDASGSSARLFPRTFNLPAIDYGPPKVAIWAYFTTTESVEGTTLYTESDCPSYMNWVWEIPIHPGRISVGFVAPGETIKALRSSGSSVEAIFRAQLNCFPRFRDLMRSNPDVSTNVTSYRCRIHRHVFGPNWLVVGEAAAMVDPMTSNGVTAALRHASEAADLIIKYRNRERLPWFTCAAYSWRVVDIARFFNCGIEKVVYDSPVRNCIGIKTAGDVYTIPAWSLNNVYSRIQPRGLLTSLFFSLLTGLFRAAASVTYNLCKYKQTPVKAAA